METIPSFFLSFDRNGSEWQTLDTTSFLLFFPFFFSLIWEQGSTNPARVAPSAVLPPFLLLLSSFFFFSPQTKMNTCTSDFSPLCHVVLPSPLLPPSLFFLDGARAEQTVMPFRARPFFSPFFPPFFPLGGKVEGKEVPRRILPSLYPFPFLTLLLLTDKMVGVY